jgi:hypothetical protein
MTKFNAYSGEFRSKLPPPPVGWNRKKSDRVFDYHENERKMKVGDRKAVGEWVNAAEEKPNMIDTYNVIVKDGPEIRMDTTFYGPDRLDLANDFYCDRRHKKSNGQEGAEVLYWLRVVTPKARKVSTCEVRVNGLKIQTSSSNAIGAIWKMVVKIIRGAKIRRELIEYA